MTTLGAPECHVLLARSSLQFLLATALAADLRERTGQACRLLFVPGMPDVAVFADAVAGWPDSPFDHVRFIDPHRRPARSRAQLLRELRVELDAAEPRSLWVFNDREEDSQALLSWALRRFPSAERFCVEDGSLAYTGFTYPAQGVTTRWRQRLRVGRGWHDVRVLGTHPLVQQFVAIHPQLLRPELRQRPTRQFPAAALAAQPLRSLATAMCARSGFAASSVAAGAVLLSLSHSSYADRNPDYCRLVQACVQRLRSRQAPWFFKYHPRETAADPLGLLGAGMVVEVPRSLPVECIYLLLRDRPLTVIGGMSTSLLTAGLLMPQVRCAALVHASGAGDAWDSRLLDALRITPLADAAGLAAYVDAFDDGAPAAAMA